MRQKPGLGGELVELLLRLFSGCWLQRRTQQRGDVRHGHSSESLFGPALCPALFVTESPSYSLSDFFKKPPRRKTSKLHDHSTAAGVLVVSKPILAFSPSQPRVERHFDHLSQHFRWRSSIFTSCTGCCGYDPRCWQYHQGCDRGNTKCPSTCRRDSTSFPSIAPDAEPRHHRDTSRTRTTWRSSPFDCTCFATI